MKKKHIMILVVLGVLLVGACYLVYSFYHPRIGSRSGCVVDSGTGNPIEGAVVNCFWEFGGFLGAVDERLAASYETTTDKDGKYFIPSRRVKRESFFDGGLHRVGSVIVYKDGYAAYTADHYGTEAGRSFGYAGHNQEYRKEDNVVKLYPWKDGESHREHVYWIKVMMGSGARAEGEGLRKELAAEWKRADAEGVVRQRSY